MKKNHDKSNDNGFLSYLIGIIIIFALFIMATITVLSNDYQERGQMRQCEETILSETYYSPVCFFGNNYEYTRMQ